MFRSDFKIIVSTGDNKDDDDYWIICKFREITNTIHKEAFTKSFGDSIHFHEPRNANSVVADSSLHLKTRGTTVEVESICKQNENSISEYQKALNEITPIPRSAELVPPPSPQPQATSKITSKITTENVSQVSHHKVMNENKYRDLIEAQGCELEILRKQVEDLQKAALTVSSKHSGRFSAADIHRTESKPAANSSSSNYRLNDRLKMTKPEAASNMRSKDIPLFPPPSSCFNTDYTLSDEEEEENKDIPSDKLVADSQIRFMEVPSIPQFSFESLQNGK